MVWKKMIICMGTLCYGPSNYSLIDGVKEDDNMYGYIMLWSI